MDTKFGDFKLSTLINCSTEVFKRKALEDFWFNFCFRESSFEITKRASIASYPDLHVFVFFEIAQVYLRLA